MQNDLGTMNTPMKNRQEMPDKGRRSLYCMLVEKHYGFAFRLAHHLLMDEDDARDATQDCFIKIWLNFDMYDDSKNFKTWLYKIVSNACFDQWRKHKRRNAAHMVSATNLESKMEASPEETFVEHESVEIIKELCESLPPRQRLVFTLRDLEQLEIKEVCEITEMDANQIKSNLYYARSQMRKKLEKINKSS